MAGCCSGCWSSSPGTCYLLDDQEGNWQAAARAVARADETDPEQAMLAADPSGAAYVFAGRQEEGAPRVVRALELLESEPSLRDDPRHLALALLCVRWLLDPTYVVGGVPVMEIGWRRIRSARSQGARAPWPSACRWPRADWPGWVTTSRRTRWPARLSSCWTCWAFGPSPGWPTRRWPQSLAARGRHAEAAALLARAEEATRATGIENRPPHLAFRFLACALRSRGP